MPDSVERPAPLSTTTPPPATSSARAGNFVTAQVCLGRGKGRSRRGRPRLLRLLRVLLAADYLAGLDAGGAHLQLAGGPAAGRGAHRLDVGVPPTVGPPVRVGHVVAEARSLAADVAHASHGVLLGLKATEGAPDSRHPGNLARLPDARGEQPIAPSRDRREPRHAVIVGAG